MKTRKQLCELRLEMGSPIAGTYRDGNFFLEKCAKDNCRISGSLSG